MTTCDIAIVGAGPYGLSAAAHLEAANGVKVRVFGEPMSFWEQHMPRGMFLRSPLVATNLSDPKRDFDVGRIRVGRKCRDIGTTSTRSIHKLWPVVSTSDHVTDLDPREVTCVESQCSWFSPDVGRWEKMLLASRSSCDRDCALRSQASTV